MPLNKLIWRIHIFYSWTLCDNEAHLRFHKVLAESPDQQRCCPYLGQLWTEHKGDMVSVNTNTEACLDISLPLKNTISKSEITAAQTEPLFHKQQIKTVCLT